MFFKDHINVINKNGEDGVKTEDNEIVDDVHHKYIGYEYKNVIANVWINVWRFTSHTSYMIINPNRD